MKFTGVLLAGAIIIFSWVKPVKLFSQPPNSSCVTATAITLPPSGSICVNGTNAGSVNNGTYNACDVLPGGNQVWYTYVTTGSQNTITVTPPGGAGSAQQVVVTITDQGCGSGTYIQCNASPTSNGTATVSWSFPLGTQVLIQVTTNGSDGNFQLCITSVNPPASPGEACNTATLLCDKSTFTVSSTASFTPSGAIPPCFFFAGQADLWYKFTVGQSGTLEFEGTPLGAAEFDWALFDITMGCPGSIVACNYNYTTNAGLSFGIGPSSCITCPTSGATALACYEHCPTINVTAGNTYALMVDNYSANGTGFTLSWGGTFLMAPTADFTTAPSTNCGSLNACFTNTSVTATAWNWDFANGNTSTVQNPACQNYTVPGIYMVSLVVTSASGCNDVASGTVTVAPLPVLATSQIDINCNGQCTGQATVTATVGAPPYTYAWSGGGVSSTKTNLCAGAYTVTVTSSQGCSAVATGTITQPATAVSASISSTNESCPTSCDGSATITASGGTPSYTYAWSTGCTSSSCNSLCDGNYTVTVTDSKGCTATQTVAVSQPAAMTLGTTSVNANCGQNDGSVTVNASGGSPGFSYIWTGGGTTSTVTGLYPGTYFVTVTDNKGCTATSLANVNNIGGGTASASTTGNASCSGYCDGAALVNMAGGTPPFNYLWSNGETNSSATILCAGTYTVTVTDSKGCTAISSGTITQPSGMTLTPSSVSSNCGQSDGIVAVSVAGGSPSYAYSWSGGGIDSSDTALTAGTYTVTVTDNKGCIMTSSAVITDIPGGTASTSILTNTSCPGSCDGSAQANMTGGTSPFTYLWSTSSDSIIATGLCASTYTVTVTDGVGCTSVSAATPTEPAPMLLSFSFTQPACTDSNGSITAIVSGGTPSYTYTWFPSGPDNPVLSNIPTGTYGVIVTDANNCSVYDSLFLNSTGSMTASVTAFTSVTCYGDSNGTATVTATGTPPYTYLWVPTGQTGQTATGLPAGVYFVIVTDGSGCSTTATVNITQPPLLYALAISTDALCFGSNDGIINLTVYDGTPGYSFLWNNLSTIEDLVASAGAYSVTITDSKGCTFTYSDNIGEPSDIVLTTVASPATCGNADGSVAVSATGGTGSYTYIWFPGGATTDIVNSVTAGLYTVTVTDANGCTKTDGAIVNNLGGPAVSVASLNNVTCYGYSDGTITVTVTGGTPPLTYLWSTSPPQGTPTANGLSAGTYTITVTDSAGCIALTDAVINEPSAVAASTYGSATICNGQPVTIGVNAAGGTIPYTYLWDNSIPDVPSTSVTPTATTTYNVTVTDANGCSAPPQSVTVYFPPPLSVSVSGNTLICEGDPAVLTASGGGGNQGPYTFTWSTGDINNPVTVYPVTTTTYYVTVSDNCGSQQATAQISVVVTPTLLLNPPSVQGCAGSSFTLSASGALTYWWSTIDDPTNTTGVGQTIIVSPATTTYYIVHGNDGTCEGVDTVTVTIIPPPDADFSLNPDSTTLLYPTISFADASTNDVTQWLWDFGDGNEDTLQYTSNTYTDTGTYYITLSVINSAGCPDAITKSLRINPEFMLFMPSSFTPNKDGRNDLFLPVWIGVNPNSYRFTIFDRWGDHIWETTDPDQGWDGRANKGGKMAQQDVYVWIIEVRDLNKKIHYYVGSVTVVK
ncbi:MAG: gliding motility-associated C-terminal domain-containing protein [Bacteroidetes bacterium]|nr:gliding motility-associated C-terminal domain-containing protein [Bacteroidota bacterium]